MNRTACATLLFLIAAAAPATAGVTYSFESATTGIVPSTVAGEGESDGPKMRIHFTRGDGHVFPDDSLALTTDGSKSLAVVDLKAKTYYILPVEDLISGLGAAGLIKATSPVAKITDAGAGPTLDGFPTRHVVVDVTYDIELGSPEKTHVTMHSDAFVTDRIPGTAANLFVTKGMRTGIPAVDKVIEANATAVSRGFTLKQTVTISAKGGMIDLSTTTTTTMTKVKVADVAASEFAMPAGLTRVDSPLEKLKKALQ
jgi:hypothetical protein